MILGKMKDTLLITNKNMILSNKFKNRKEKHMGLFKHNITIKIHLKGLFRIGVEIEKEKIQKVDYTKFLKPKEDKR
jgi:hypothetical protein